MSDESTAVVEEEVETEPAQEEQAKTEHRRQPRYHVVLWDDPDHTHAFVIMMLAKLFAHPLPMGRKLAREVDKKGRAIVYTTTLEHAELKRDQIHAFGKDDLVDGCKGSMKASIEPET
jgi:ATP-dependent Clp protease adaptor protein ClpS